MFILTLTAVPPGPDWASKVNRLLPAGISGAPAPTAGLRSRIVKAAWVCRIGPRPGYSTYDWPDATAAVEQPAWQRATVGVLAGAGQQVACTNE